MPPYFEDTKVLSQITKLVVLTLATLAHQGFSKSTRIPQSLPVVYKVTADGSVTASLNFHVPEGVNGLTPKLGMVYHSRSRLSSFAWGTSLTGAPQIARCKPLKEEGFFDDPVDFDANDRFCLDQSQLLPLDTSNKYGTPGITYTLSDRKNIKVISIPLEGNKQYFKVSYPDGKTLVLGKTSESRTEGDPGTFSWRVNQLHDAYGNTISYHYKKIKYGEVLLDYIQYTNFDSGLAKFASKGSSTKKGPFKVKFNYEDLRSIQARYVGGVRIFQSKIIKSIDILHHNSVKQSYLFAYSYHREHRPVLTGAKLCTSVNECSMTTKLKWQGKEKDFSQSNFGPKTHISYNLDFDESNKSIIYMGDFNGDGWKDVLKFKFSGMYIAYHQGLDSDGTPQFSGLEKIEGYDFGYNANWRPSQHLLQVSDIDQDGFDDIVTFSDSGIFVTKGSQNGFNETELWTNKFSNKQWNQLTRKRTFIDMNRDSFPDLVVMEGANTWVSIQQDGVLLEPIKWGIDSRLTHYSPSLNWEDDDIFFRDMNGDRLPDLLIREDETKTILLSINMGDRFGKTEIIDDNSLLKGFNDDSKFLAFDINGDGLVDLIKMNADLKVRLNRGNDKFTKPISYDREYKKKSATSDRFRTFVDLDRDGLLEYVTDDDGYSTAYNASSKMKTRKKISYDFTGFSGWNYFKNPTYFEDIDGDGMVDLLGFGYGGLAYSKNIGKQLLLVQVDNGLGKKVYFDYKALTDSSVYSPEETELSFPLKKYSGAYTVASSMSIDNGLNGQKTVSYHYHGMRTHAEHGVLGFQKRTVTDESTKHVQTFTYNQDAESRILGRVVRIETHTPDANGILQLSGETTTDFVEIQGDNSLQINVQTKKQVSVHYNDDGQEVSRQTIEFEYNEYFNPSKVTTTNIDQYGIKTTIDQTNYYRNTDQWIIDRPLSHTKTDVYIDHRLNRKKSVAMSVGEWEYNAQGQLVATIRNPMRSKATRSSFTYNSRGQIVATTQSWPNWREDDGLNFQSLTNFTSYDEYGHIQSKTNAKGHVTQVDADPFTGVALKTIDANGHITSVKIDSLGNIVKLIKPSGEVLEKTISKCDASCPEMATSIHKSESNLGFVSLVYLDGYGRKVRESKQGFDGRMIHTDIEYTKFGQIKRKSLPYFENESHRYWTAHDYDHKLLLTELKLPDGNTQNFESNNLTTSVTNSKGQKTTTVRDSLGNKVEVTDNLGSTTRYYYNARNVVWKTVTENGQVTTNYFDEYGQRTAMVSPDRGRTEYTYNRLGKIYLQKSANGWQTTSYHDSLGRVIRSINNDDQGQTEVRIFEYDGENSVGLLKKSTLQGKHSKEFEYDSKSRPVRITETIDGQVFSTLMSYDHLSRINSKTFPTGFKLGFHYNAYGFQDYVYSYENPRLKYWEARQYDASGRLLESIRGNGITETFSYHETRGFMTSNKASLPGRAIQDFSYLWDEVGNLGQRTDNKLMRSETFAYDNLNRLISYDNGLGKVLSTRFDQQGNITFKSDVGEYTYGGSCNGVKAGPHAVTAIKGLHKDIEYCYDESGYMLSGDGRTFEYSPIGKPSRIYNQDGDTEIFYGSEGDRYKRVDSKEGKVIETLYAGSYERVKDGSTIIHKHRVNGAIVEWRGSEKEVFYLHEDHLGSVTSITNSEGKITASYSYDPWGRRRTTNDFSYIQLGLIASPTQDGFTGHEHIDTVGLIHMNGRVFDPVIARFTSADPFVQAPFNSQSLNRYSYVLNNPLNATDPSGYFFKQLGKALGSVLDGAAGGVHRLGSWLSKPENQKQVAVMAVSLAVPASWGYLGAFAVGAVSGYVMSGGDTKAALVGGASGAIAFGIGNQYEALKAANKLGPVTAGIGKVAAHGILGGTRSVVMGGTFESGFTAGSISAAVAVSGVYSHLPAIDNKVSRSFMAGIIAGATSEIITKGSFEDAATIGFFQHLLNHEMHTDSNGDCVIVDKPHQDLPDGSWVETQEGPSMSVQRSTKLWQDPSKSFSKELGKSIYGPVMIPLSSIAAPYAAEIAATRAWTYCGMNPSACQELGVEFTKGGMAYLGYESIPSMEITVPTLQSLTDRKWLINKVIEYGRKATASYAGFYSTREIDKRLKD